MRFVLSIVMSAPESNGRAADRRRHSLPHNASRQADACHGALAGPGRGPGRAHVDHPRATGHIFHPEGDGINCWAAWSRRPSARDAIARSLPARRGSIEAIGSSGEWCAWRGPSPSCRTRAFAKADSAAPAAALSTSFGILRSLNKVST
jgi:hypothetical protein